MGTAFVLARECLIQLDSPETTITFEEGVGDVAVTLSVRDGHLYLIQMRQPLPTFGPVFADREAIAQMLSLDLAHLEITLPLEVVSCGVPFLFVPVKSLEVMRAIRFRLDIGGVLVLVYARSTHFVLALMVLFLLGLVTTAVNVVAGPLVLHVTPRELIGRVTSVLMPALNLATLLSVAVAGYLNGTVLRSFHATLVGY